MATPDPMIKVAIERLYQSAQHYGAEVKEVSPGHYHIKGKLLVNYYPASKSKSAYVAGTTSKKENVTPEIAVAMAFVPPSKACEKNKRKKSYRSDKAELWKKFKNRFCHWCKKPLTFKTATMEHIVPLARGGLNNMNNQTLACANCNHGRGSDMPELSES